MSALDVDWCVVTPWLESTWQILYHLSFKTFHNKTEIPMWFSPFHCPEEQEAQHYTRLHPVLHRKQVLMTERGKSVGRNRWELGRWKETGRDPWKTGFSWKNREVQGTPWQGRAVMGEALRGAAAGLWDERDRWRGRCVYHGNYSSQLDVSALPLTVFVQTNQEKHRHSIANVANFFLSELLLNWALLGCLETFNKCSNYVSKVNCRPFTEKTELKGDLTVFHFCRWSTWPAMPKTIWCLFFTLIAWTWLSRSLATGTTTSTDSWRERVCMKYNWVVFFGTEINRSLLMCFHVLFHCFSGVWILVRPCEQLVEEEADLLKHPLHVLRRHDWGISVNFVGSFDSGYFFLYSSPLAGYKAIIICDYCLSRTLDGK